MKQFAGRGLLMLFLLTVIPFHADADLSVPDVNYSDAWAQYLERDAETDPGAAYPFASCFRRASENYRIPYAFLLAVARGESFFNPKAESHKSCYGVMQIRWPETAKHLGINRRKDLFSPCTNIFAGAKYLRELLDRYDGNLHLALAAYNYGPGRIPKNAARDHIPDGANWYSGYIYHHMKSILDKPPREKTTTAPGGYQKKLAVITFNQPYRAQGFLAFMDKKAPYVKMDIFKTPLGRFQVVLLYRHEKDLIRAKQILKNFGLVVRLPGKS